MDEKKIIIAKIDTLLKRMNDEIITTSIFGLRRDDVGEEIDKLNNRLTRYMERIKELAEELEDNYEFDYDIV